MTASMRPSVRWLLAILAVLSSAGPKTGQARGAPRSPAPAIAREAQTIELSAGWALVSAANVGAGGAMVSQPGYNVSGWYPVALPSTVLAGLVANGVYTDIYSDTNLQAVPDLTTQKWWYRGEFTAPAGAPSSQYWLRFKGVAYKAQVWLNGVQVDSAAVGTLVNHEYNVTGLVQPGATNALALLVTPPTSAGTNLSFWYVDWNPKPPDMNAGIWGKVLLDASGSVVLRDPYVKTVLPLPATDSADLTVYVDASNGSSGPVTGTLSGQITKEGFPTIAFSREVTLNAGERREVAFDPLTFPELHVANPALWWPIHLGSPELYDLQLTFSVGGQPSDVRSTSFGIRQFTDYVTPPIYGHTYRGYKVNGQNVLIRGADYVWDMLLRTPSKINEAHMAYVKDMGLNLLRFEGILGNEEIYDRADRYGIMLMPGYVCCTYWAQYGSWTPQDVAVANASTESQMRLLRAHPSSLVWAYGSDELPPNTVLSAWKVIASNLHWQNPTLDNVASYANPNGSVPKMNGPYAWEPPVYWYVDTTRGGAFGFCAEQGGESVPPEETLHRFLSAANVWPIGPAYGYHSGPSPFNNLNWYSLALNSRYGAAGDLTQYSDRAQLLNYESERAQFEAYGAHAYSLAQGTVYWMLNNAWPSVHWNLYDYFFKPGGGYFGTKKALEPVHVIYDYNTRNVNVFNATRTAADNMTAKVTVYNVPDLAVKHTHQVTMNFPANASTQAFTIPPISDLSATYLVRLQLQNTGGHVVSENLYWYSTSPDVLGAGGDWYYTSVSSYANLAGLNSLASNSAVTAASSRVTEDDTDTVTITLTNTSSTSLAFFLRPEVTAGSGGLEVTPITYTDNYLSLFPGESITITARYAHSDLGGQTPYLRVRGYNVPSAFSPVGGVEDAPLPVPDHLRENTPNPFTTRTTIGFDLFRTESARVRIYDVTGRLVRRLVDGPTLEPGSHSVEWDGRNDAGELLGSGLYFCRLETGERIKTRRIVFVR